MTKIQRVGMVLMVGTTLTLLASCNKLLDYLKDHPDGTTDLCRIQKMRYYVFNDSTDIDFTYNAWGDPVSAIRQKSIGTPDALFRYDAQHRLTDYIEAYKNGSFESWHRYVYDNNNRIIRDTTYIFGAITDEPPQPDEVFDIAIVYYDYDNMNRITHTRQQWYSFPDPADALNLYYQYDANGNLMLSGGAVYDNRVSVPRASRIWMFIDRDYSVNNAFASQYNDNGLPTRVSMEVPSSNLAGFYSGKGLITYKCK